jgi:hypothetical protein
LSVPRLNGADIHEMIWVQRTKNEKVATQPTKFEHPLIKHDAVHTKFEVWRLESWRLLGRR